MEIAYRINTNIHNLEELMNTPMVGFDPDHQGCSASFGVHKQDYPVWITYMSNSTYIRLHQGDGFEIWQYSGAENGFQQQNLLPDALKHGTVLAVSGSYGHFEGAGALRQYSKKKESFVAEHARNIGAAPRGGRVNDRLEVSHEAASLFRAISAPALTKGKKRFGYLLAKARNGEFVAA